MKNTKIFPLERNQYYYGKLLSVEDFNLEQTYISNKQRMNNMFLSGSGIVCGMNVVSVGDQTISVESGCALDAFGREMALDVPVIKKLSLIDGFEQSTAKGENYIYLCVEYDEKPTDPVFNLAGNQTISSSEENCTYNKITETAHLFCTNHEPELNGIESEGLLKDCRQLYIRKGISIRQSFPRYVEAGKKVVVEIEIETTEKNYLAFSYKMNLNGLTFEKENSLTVQFDEMLVEKSGSYVLQYELDAVPTPGYQATASIEEESFKVIIDQRPKEASSAEKYTVDIVENNIKERVIEDYFKNSMSTLQEKARQKYIYLAKIYLMKADDAYQIDKVINAPMKQYVMSQTLLGSLNKIMMKEIQSLQEKVQMQEECGGCPDNSKKDNCQVQIAQGIYEMKLGLHGENHKKFFSTPISHELGLGYVTVILSQETRQNETIFGNPEIFRENYVDASLAAKVDESTGTFVIGAKLNETIAKNSIKIHWVAIRKKEDVISENLERRITIKPGMLELYTRECAYLETAFYNMDDKQITWKVKKGGGEVDETNVYTAPNEKGVYEIVAQSVAYPEVKASIFAVVRERK